VPQGKKEKSKREKGFARCAVIILGKSTSTTKKQEKGEKSSAWAVSFDKRFDGCKRPDPFPKKEETDRGGKGREGNMDGWGKRRDSAQTSADLSTGPTHEGRLQRRSSNSAQEKGGDTEGKEEKALM